MTAMWIEFLKDFDWGPEGAMWRIAYKAGMRANVPTEAAAAAVQAGCAVEIKAPPRAEAAELVADPYWRA
jgi:hypothetical protein